MKSMLKTVVMIFLGLVSFTAKAQITTNISTDSIFPKGQRVPEANFTGMAWVYNFIETDSSFNIPIAHVTFEAGARTYWHMHAGGQVLIAIGGIGYYQEKGKPIQILRKGDSVKCPADTPHWHGASPESEFMQIAVTPNTAKGRTTWLKKVSDEEYNSLKK